MTSSFSSSINLTCDRPVSFSSSQNATENCVTAQLLEGTGQVSVLCQSTSTSWTQTSFLSTSNQVAACFGKVMQLIGLFSNVSNPQTAVNLTYYPLSECPSIHNPPTYLKHFLSNPHVEVTLGMSKKVTACFPQLEENATNPFLDFATQQVTIQVPQGVCHEYSLVNRSSSIGGEFSLSCDGNHLDTQSKVHDLVTCHSSVGISYLPNPNSFSDNTSVTFQKKTLPCPSSSSSSDDTTAAYIVLGGIGICALPYVLFRMYECYSSIQKRRAAYKTMF